MKITRKDIQDTQAYKNLSRSLKKVVISNNNIKYAIEKALNKILRDGYKDWFLNTKTRRYNVLIIDEIIDKHFK